MPRISRSGAGATPRRRARPTRWKTARRLGIFVLVGLMMIPSATIILYSVVNPPLTPLMVIRRFEGERIHQQWQPLDRISRHLIYALIAAEDNRFCRHRGFDVDALTDQFDAWASGTHPRGASTITMQTAKNILLWPGRNWPRKVIEAWMTPQIELLWSKQRILEVYVNVIEFGAGVYGAEAAARTYFGISAARLDERQASLLAAVLPAPRTWSLTSPHVTGKARVLRTRVRQLGALLDCATPVRAAGGPKATAAVTAAPTVTAAVARHLAPASVSEPQ
jgi:monofunctional glycosyltransferase